MKQTLVKLAGLACIAAAATSAQAGTATVGNVSISWDDAFLGGVTVTQQGGELVFSDFNFEAYMKGATGVTTPTVSTNAYGDPQPVLTITALSGVLNTVTQTVSGYSFGAVSSNALAVAKTNLITYWTNAADATQLAGGQQISGAMPIAHMPGTDEAIYEDPYSFTQTVNLGSAGVKSANLSTLTLSLFALVQGEGAAGVNATEYRIGATTAAAVPEPEAIAMMLAGLGVVGLRLRRRQA